MAKILVVDDDLTVTKFLEMLLSMEGHEPTTVNNSSETLEIAEQIHPDLITLDLMMPGLSGYELCELLHKDPRFKEIPILIVSAWDDREHTEKADHINVQGYISKPFRVETLLQKINELTSS